MMDREQQSKYDRQINKYTREIKNCLQVYVMDVQMFCFEFRKKRYVVDAESLTYFYVYDDQQIPPFSPAFQLAEDKLFHQVIHLKAAHSMEDGNFIGDDYGDVEYDAISKSRKQFIEIIDMAKEKKFRPKEWEYR